MVGPSEGAGSTIRTPQTPGRSREAATVLQSILETGNLRYWIIASWALALATAVTSRRVWPGSWADLTGPPWAWPFCALAM